MSVSVILHGSSSCKALHTAAGGGITRHASSPTLLPPGHEAPHVQVLPARPKSNLSGGPQRTAHHASPRSAEELFQPLTHRQAQPLPEWAQSYMSLLAECSTSPGGMQRHLMKLLARGAANATKVATFVHDPLNPLTGHLANTGSELLLRHNPLKSMDDCCVAVEPDAPAPTAPNPMHSKVLSLLLSMIMSGAISASGIADNIPNLASLQGLGRSADTETFVQLQQPPSASTPMAVPARVSAFSAEAGMALQAASPMQMPSSMQSMQRAPSLMSPGTLARAPSGMEAILGAGGMATSTVMKLLRADSKHIVLPDFGNVLESVLDSVSESMDDGDLHPPINSSKSTGDIPSSAKAADGEPKGSSTEYKIKAVACSNMHDAHGLSHSAGGGVVVGDKPMAVACSGSQHPNGLNDSSSGMGAERVSSSKAAVSEQLQGLQNRPSIDVLADLVI